MSNIFKDVVKGFERINHKHDFKECLFVENGHPHLGTYCTICGKIEKINSWEMMNLGNGLCRMLKDEEVFDKYRHLKQIKIKDIFQKYVETN